MELSFVRAHYNELLTFCCTNASEGEESLSPFRRHRAQIEAFREPPGLRVVDGKQVLRNQHTVEKELKESSTLRRFFILEVNAKGLEHEMKMVLQAQHPCTHLTRLRRNMGAYHEWLASASNYFLSSIFGKALRLNLYTEIHRFEQHEG